MLDCSLLASVILSYKSENKVANEIRRSIFDMSRLVGFMGLYPYQFRPLNLCMPSSYSDELRNSYIYSTLPLFLW